MPVTKVSEPMAAACSNRAGFAAAACSEEGPAQPPGVAQASHAQGGRQRARHAVTHRVGQRQVEHVAAQAVVEGVAADRRRRLQPPRKGEGPGLAGERRRQQPPLDLRGQGEDGAALPPLEQVGVPPVRDDHERQHVPDASDLRQRLRVRGPSAGTAAATREPHLARSRARERPIGCPARRHAPRQAEELAASGCAEPPRPGRHRAARRPPAHRRRPGRHSRSRPDPLPPAPRRTPRTRDEPVLAPRRPR